MEGKWFRAVEAIQIHQVDASAEQALADMAIQGFFISENRQGPFPMGNRRRIGPAEKQVLVHLPGPFQFLDVFERVGEGHNVRGFPCCCVAKLVKGLPAFLPGGVRIGTHSCHETRQTGLAVPTAFGYHIREDPFLRLGRQLLRQLLLEQVDP